ncbi:hypothetical protein ELS19_05070 [Halogeometricum borinquense]|uniref:Restriction endonuclease type IV Mrr domain-containing protein n=1 Tax=Halogeometricum borinquense TaxID=60847 RepID=A0A482T979_9EURY|nr:hypothetical protein [Halogeometricum borinquense]RYJ13397.1 hypothetical protein ELS19_05070 [Halogeometricum borinquense]
MLPGFEIRDNAVGIKVGFDPIRLEQDSSITLDGDLDDGRYVLSSDCHDAIESICDTYYEKHPEIRDFSWGTILSLRCIEEDAEILCKLLAQEIIISVSAFGEECKFTYEELLEKGNYEFDIGSASIDDFSDIELDVDDLLEKETPNGISNPTFTHDNYLTFMSDYVRPVVSRSGWSGGNAWLINNAIRELRNGRFEAAAYCFEGSRLGLTKHSNFDQSLSRLSKIVDRALITVRELCLSQTDTSASPSSVELYAEMENRDLVYIPHFTGTPSLHDQYFRFQNEVWIANALVLVQSVAHAMDPPTISRGEVDPFGSGLSVRNWSFTVKVAKELHEIGLDSEYVGDSPFTHLEHLDFEKLAPEITLTRILSNSDFDVRTYSADSIGSDEEELKIAHDFIVEREESYYIVRALRPEDESKDVVRALVEKLASSRYDHQLMLIFESELDESALQYYTDHELIEAYYVDLSSERMYTIESGFPPSFDDLTTDEEIRKQISELYNKAKNADSTDEKGESLELLMQLIFEKGIVDTRVRDVNVRTRVEEIDLQLINGSQRYPWDHLGSPINVECKNWSETAGVDVIYTAYGKAQATSPDCKGIILVCWEGISDSYKGRNGDQVIRELRGKGTQILTLDKSDLQRIAETGDAQGVFEEKADELWDR